MSRTRRKTSSRSRFRSRRLGNASTAPGGGGVSTYKPVRYEDSTNRCADRIAVSATKSLVGHTLGAAGAIAGVATVLAIHTGQIHPTANYDEPDPACALRGLSGSVQERKVKAALLNAFGFGSNNAAVVIKRYAA